MGISLGCAAVIYATPARANLDQAPRAAPVTSPALPTPAPTEASQPGPTAAMPTPAPAERSVLLRSGQRVQGSLIDVQPGQFLRLRLADGSIQHLLWGDIMLIALPRPDDKPTSGSAPSDAPGVRVLFYSDRPVNLWRDQADDAPALLYENLTQGVLSLRSPGRYRVGSTDVSGARFPLLWSVPTRITVRTGSRTKKDSGNVLLTVGILGTLTTEAALLGALVNRSSSGSFDTAPYLLGGLGGLCVSLSLLGAGIGLITAGQTHVSTDL